MTDDELEQLTEVLEEIAVDLNLLSSAIRRLEGQIGNLVEIAKALLQQRLN